MGTSGIPDELRNFILENISSIGQLEILLLLYKNRKRKWTSEAIGEEMRSSEVAANQQLNDLQFCRLVTKKRDLDTILYEFGAVSREQERMVGLLEEYYNDYRVLIISLIYDKPSEALRYFANAFKLKKDM